MKDSDSQTEFGPVPRGMEVLISKASVDPEFRAILLDRRAAAAAEIGLELDPSEAMMLDVAPTAQLKAIIAGTSVPMAHRRAFLGKAAAAMLAAITAMEVSVSMADEPTDEASGGAKVEFPQPPPPAPPVNVESRVIDSVARALRIPRSRVTRFKTFAQLEIRGHRGELVRKEVEGNLGVTLSRAPFGRLRTVSELIDMVQLARGVGPAVVEIIARVFPTTTDQVGWRTTLAVDLRATPEQLDQLRKDLSSTFRISLGEEEFKQLNTVGQVVEAVEAAVRLRKQIDAQQKQNQISRGVRPDVPPSAPPP